MVVVTVEHEDHVGALPADGGFTIDDLEELPDDGRRYELFDGVLVVSAAPNLPHQRAVRVIALLLDRACPPELEVFFAPLDFQPTKMRSFQPDVLVVRNADLDEEDDRALRKPPVLAVEVLSPSTRSLDRVFKREMYATSGVNSFWIFDPQRIEFVAYERKDDGYVEVARARGDERISLERPYPVEICPAEFVRG